jgi:hypothetical protein
MEDGRGKMEEGSNKRRERREESKKEGRSIEGEHPVVAKELP